MKKLFSRLVALVALFSISSCLQEERSPEEILIPSPAQVDCSESAFSLTSKVPSGSENLVYECGFLVGKDKLLGDGLKVEGALTANTFSAAFPLREYGTTYYMCAYVTNGHGSEIRSDLRSFELQALEEYVEFGQVSMLSYDPLSRQALITVDTDIWAGVNVTEAGVCYGTEPSSLTVEGDHKSGTHKYETRAEGGVIEILLDGFEDATQYYLRPYLKDGGYLTYGEVVPFYIPSVAKVSTFDAEDITPSGAKFSGEVTDECGSPVTERGFAWIEGDGTPTVESDHVVSGSGLGTMTATIEGLNPNRKYTFRAYATNASGTSYGDPKTFTTLVALPVLSTSTITDITSKSATFNGVLADDGGESISEVGFYYSTSKEVDPLTAEKVSIEYSTYQKSARELSENTLLSALQSAQKAASDEGESFSIDVFNLAIKTRYYVKSYAVNSAGTAYGAVVNFETAGEIATIRTVGSSEVTTGSAVLSGNVTSDNGEKITERGFVWMQGTGTPTTDSDRLKVTGTVGEYTATLTGLEPNRKYSFRAYAINAEGTAYGDVMSFTTVTAPPTLSSVVISSITSTSATLSSKVASHGGETVTEVGFYYSTDKDLNLETATKVSLPYSEDAFSVNATELLINTKYYVKAYAKNSAGTEYSEIETFTTSISSPSVRTENYSDVTSSSATLSGIVISDNGASITERGFVWMQGTGTPTTDSFKLKVDGTTGYFTSTLTGLEPNQKYSFRAYAINSKGTAYGDVMTFSTIVGLPVLSPVGVSDVTAISATFAADVTDQGGENVAEVGFYYSTEETVDPETSIKVKKNYTGTAFTASVSDLLIFTTYYVKAYAVNSAGVAYSDVVSFKTLASTPVVNTLAASEVSSDSAVLSGKVVTDNGAAITERGFVWLKGSDAPTTSSNKLKVDGATGEFTSTLDGLEPNQKYSFRAYAINSKGTSYGDIMNFTTVAGLPTLSAMKVSDITPTSATFTCAVTGHGGDIVSEVGFYIGKEENVDIETALKISEAYTSDSFTLTTTDLEVGTEYYVKAYTKNSVGESYSAIVPFKTVSTAPTVNTIGYSRLSDTSVKLSGNVLDDNGEPLTDRGFVWIKGASTPTTSHNKLQVSGETGEYTGTLSDIVPNEIYSFRAYAVNSKGTSYGEVIQLQINISLPCVTTNDVTGVTNTSAMSGGVITDDGDGEILSKGVVWSLKKNPTIDLQTKTDEGEGNASFTSHLTDLRSGFVYYVRAYATNIVGTTYGEEIQFATTGEIKGTPLEAANSFIISYPGVYLFRTVKGNSNESVGDVASAEVLWESFGTDEQPEVGSLVSFATYKDGTIAFATPDEYREGNAVIAAKDANGTVLWSWHIWLTDQPQEHVYPNNAGTMMDRNLGATSIIPGDVGALGLLYQWGRKDPFLGSSSIFYKIEPMSTIVWPSSVSSDLSTGTNKYAIQHPTTYITYNETLDWYYTGNAGPDNTRWQSHKTVYDPCPSGWRVPDGGNDGVWATLSLIDVQYDNINEGLSLHIDNQFTTWYPAAGYRLLDSGGLNDVGQRGVYWSVTPNGNDAFFFDFYNDGNVYYMNGSFRSSALSVRCLKEGTGGGPKYDNDFSTSGARDLSYEGTANSYIVSSSGTYSISPIKGNGSESVGSVASAEVLWETFGTDENIIKGNLISGARYENGRIYFKTADAYREGNAVVAAKDAAGTILWSWHIWLTDQPQEQIYNNSAGTMMDRNLGATSATPGDVGALGLLYQWGRKDPFLGFSSISSEVEAQSTITWPSAVSSDSSTGTVDYVTSHPMTFVKGVSPSSYDWHYSSRDNTLWQSEKTIYDPCPVGWRVTDGGDEGVWSIAQGSILDYYRSYDGTNEGMNFSGDFGSFSTLWYPASGYRNDVDGALYSVGDSGYYWSVTPFGGSSASSLNFYDNGNVHPAGYKSRAQGNSVRCLKEGTGGGPQYDNDFSTSGAKNLSEAGTANSYIVSSTGTYSIPAVKGNSSESVGSVASAEVLWETFGTDEKINIGSLVHGAKYVNDLIYFRTADIYREGNAVIAAKDSQGNILWSWHIWLTDEPLEQIYNNNAGSMMDRNLGATSATPGDVGALGLLYQWGRKDPFLGSSSISDGKEAKSTITWPSRVSSNASNGTIGYSVLNPTTFIKDNSSNHDWYYTGSSSTDDTRWQSEKTIYDPCPVGWRVPDGGSTGVWNTAGFANTSYDSSNKGISFSISSPSTTWYPASGYRKPGTGPVLSYVGDYGYYWSVTPDSSSTSILNFNSDGYVDPTYNYYRAYGFSVRCLQESE